MRSILVVSTKPDAFNTIHERFRSGFTVEKAPNRDNAVITASRKRCDFIFVDLELLGDTEEKPDYRAAMKSFWGMYGSSEIIVMAQKEAIRAAVRAVRAGASDYITYPVDPHEAKYVVESIDEYITMQSKKHEL